MPLFDLTEQKAVVCFCCRFRDPILVGVRQHQIKICLCAMHCIRLIDERAGLMFWTVSNSIASGPYKEFLGFEAMFDEMNKLIGNVQSNISICKTDFLLHYLILISTNKFALKPQISFTVPSNLYIDKMLCASCIL